MGVIVNYGPEDAIQFDLKRNPVQILDRSSSPGSSPPDRRTGNLKVGSLPPSGAALSLMNFGASPRSRNVAL